MTSRLQRKIVVIGDSGCGKTSLLFTYGHGQFPWPFSPSYFDSLHSYITIDGQEFDVALWDTMGHDEYDRLRPLSYVDSSAFVIAFSIGWPESLLRVQEKWLPEVLHFRSNPQIPYILLGCKSDLRHPTGFRPSVIKSGGRAMEREEGETVAKQIGAAAYMECSSLTGEGVEEVFERAIRRTLEPLKKSRRDCIIL